MSMAAWYTAVRAAAVSSGVRPTSGVRIEKRSWYMALLRSGGTPGRRGADSRQRRGPRARRGMVAGVSGAPAEQDHGPGAHVLSGVRVLEFTSGVAGAYCTKLLADAGADVVRVERDGAGPRRPTGLPGLFEYLDTSKRSVGPVEGARLVGAADIVVAGAGFDVEAARTGSPALVVVTITAVRAHRTLGRPAGYRIHDAGRLRLHRRPRPPRPGTAGRRRKVG